MSCSKIAGKGVKNTLAMRMHSALATSLALLIVVAALRCRAWDNQARCGFAGTGLHEDHEIYICKDCDMKELPRKDIPENAEMMEGIIPSTNSETDIVSLGIEDVLKGCRDEMESMLLPYNNRRCILEYSYYGSACPEAEYKQFLSDMKNRLQTAIELMPPDFPEPKKYDMAKSILKEIVKLPDSEWTPLTQLMQRHAGISGTWSHDRLVDFSGREYRNYNGTLKGLADKFIASVDPVIYVTDAGWLQYGAGVYNTLDMDELHSIVHSHLLANIGHMKAGDVDKGQRTRFIGFLQAERGVYIGRSDKLNPNRWLLNLRNTMYEIRTGETRCHSPNYMSTVQLPFNYDPTAQCPRFLQFLDEVLPNEPETHLFLQEYVGSCLVPETKYQVFLILLGTGGNGKSVLVEVLKNLVGPANCSFLSLSELSAKHRIHMLKDKLLNIGTENENRVIRDTSTLKKLVSGDEDVIGERKFKDPSSFLPTCKFIFSSNHMFKFADTTEGLRRRLRAIQFNQSFKDEKRDLELTDKLLLELPGILNWAVEGYQRLQANNGKFTESTPMAAAAGGIIEMSSSVVMFVNAVCEVGNLNEDVPRGELYWEYTEFCKIEKLRVLGQRQFLEDLKRFYPAIQTPQEQVRRYGKRDRLVLGIRLK